MRVLLLVLLVSLTAGVGAAQKVQVLALFPGKAMLQVDGARKVLAEGKSFRGVTLLSANTDEARVSFNGEEQILTLGSAVSASYQVPEKREIRLLGSGKSFYIDGLINGQPMRMLVDTGATLVALSERHARQLGLAYVEQGLPSKVQTAGGLVDSYHVQLRNLRLGDVSFDDVQAVVIQGNSPQEVLLGMNVLSRFDIEHRTNLMILRTKH